MVYGSPCDRPGLLVNYFFINSEKNCFYSFLSSSEKNLNDLMFQTAWLSVITLPWHCPDDGQSGCPKRPVIQVLLQSYSRQNNNSWPFVRCHGCWFMHTQFHSRRYSLRITQKYTTLVRMHSGSAWTGIHVNGAEVTNSLR